jgi:protein-disulfide isomerase
MGKGTWIIFGLLAAALVGLFVLSSMNSNRIDVSGLDANSVMSAKEENGEIGDHVRGNPNASIVIVEYGDFQCPSCAQLSPRMSVLMEDYGDDVALVFRNFIIDGHQNSRFATSSAEAAGLQGKYWEMHDIIFREQASWSSATIEQRTDIFLGFAREIGLDEEQFKTDLESPRITRKISFDRALANTKTITGTPSLFLGDDPIAAEVWGTDARLRSFLNDKIKERGGTPPTASTDSADKTTVEPVRDNDY